MTQKIDVLAELGDTRKIIGWEVKLPEDPLEKAHRHRLEYVRFFTCVTFILAILVFSMALVCNNDVTEDIKKQAWIAVQSTLTGLFGFLAGRGIKI